jgi:hypothetical protein
MVQVGDSVLVICILSKKSYCDCIVLIGTDRIKLAHSAYFRCENVHSENIIIYDGHVAFVNGGVFSVHTGRGVLDAMDFKVNYSSEEKAAQLNLCAFVHSAIQLSTTKPLGETVRRINSAIAQYSKYATSPL